VRRAGRQSGVTILEMAFAAAIAASMLGAGVAITSSLQAGGAAQTKKSTLASRAQEVVDRLSREFSVAGIGGEDSDLDHALDAGEDVDRDGRLDSDWSLADASSASDVTFNVMRQDWTWSGPIRWNVDADGLLWRTEDGASAEMARGVQTFSVTRTGLEVEIDLTLGGTDSAGESQTQSTSRRVYVRN
jgi:hypothetical protein